MLLIGDVHLTSKIKDTLISQLKFFISEHNEEKNLIFLGDFVYHFSYDRNALLELYDLFLELYAQGRNIYILAGNHDRLGNTFIFEEGRKAFEVLSRIKDKNNEICFITKPIVKKIEGKNICFLPAMLEINEKDFPGIEDLKDEQFEEETKNKNKNIVFSAQLNLVIKRFTRQYSDLVLIHHYYIEGISFPGQKAKFTFKDRALSHNWLDNPYLTMISGHLHENFSYKNYLCTGSIWATSPLETDQIKYFRIRRDGKFLAQETGINYYFTMERKTGAVDLFSQEFKAINQNDILFHRKSIQKSSLKNFESPLFQIESHFDDDIDMKKVSLSVSVEKLQYDNMSEFIEPELQQSLQNIQLKKDTTSTEKLLEQLERPDEGWGFLKWLELLKKFLEKQYPDEYEEYEKLLQEMKIL